MNIIDVLCFVFPTGETYWTTDVKNRQQVIDNFRAANPDLDKDCTMGMVHVRMPTKLFRLTKKQCEMMAKNEEGFEIGTGSEEPPKVGLPDSKALLCVLDRIQGLCIGEIAMGTPLDANCISEMIYEATGMTAEELTRYCKSLDE